MKPGSPEWVEKEINFYEKLKSSLNYKKLDELFGIEKSIWEVEIEQKIERLKEIGNGSPFSSYEKALYSEFPGFWIAEITPPNIKDDK